MKRIFVMLLFLFFFYCSENTLPTEDIPIHSSILLSLQKSLPSESIKFFKIELSKVGFNNISILEKLSDKSKVEISSDNLATGIWHIKVEACGADTISIYWGEKELDILTGRIIPLDLELINVNGNLGRILITLHSENFNYDWFDYPHNPIITKTGNEFDYMGILESFVIKDEDVYKMWYTGLVSGGKGYIFYATSYDGLVWNKFGMNPIISPGYTGAWDSDHVQSGPVIKEAGVYRMYYTGWKDQNSQWHIGLAYSTDGINWSKKPDPVIYAGNVWDFKICATSIVKKDETYYLFFCGKEGIYNWKIGMATSLDGVNWTKHPSNPVLTPDISWEGGMTLYPAVIYENGLFNMIYQGNNSLGIAYSTNGFNWTKSGKNPIFTTAQTKNSIIKVSYPNLVKINNEYRIYYTGFYSNNESFIAMARKVILNPN